MKIDRTILLASRGVRRTGGRGGFFRVSECSRCAPAAQAQNIGQRVVSGAVLNDASEPVIGATVFLRNEKTKAIRSYTSTKMGHFYFAQVNMAEDYELWAEKGGKKSATKTVSSWDSRKEYVNDLKLK